MSTTDRKSICYLFLKNMKIDDYLPPYFSQASRFTINQKFALSYSQLRFLLLKFQFFFYQDLSDPRTLLTVIPLSLYLDQRLLMKTYLINLYWTVSGAAQQLRKRIKDGSLICHLFHKNVKMDDLALAKEIHDLDPCIIDWSNVPDYLEKNKFIKFARSCSTDHTIHFAIFINWTNYVSKLFLAVAYKKLEPILAYHMKLNIVKCVPF